METKKLKNNKRNGNLEKWDKIVLVTGGMGFIGSHYLNICVMRYPSYFFINIDSLTYAARPKNVRVKNNRNYLFKKIDIRDSVALEKIFKKFAPTHIVHFAAESHVDLSITSPHTFVETNVNGTHNLLFLAKKYNLQRFHHVSTDEVYGSLDLDGKSFTEETPLAPNSPYSATKTASDLLVRAYFKTYGLNVVITRCSNNYGPHQDETKLIPRFITLLLKNLPVPLYSTGKNIRDWLFVEDHVEAIDRVFHNGRTGEIYNVGGDLSSEKTNLEITKTLLKHLGKDESYIRYVADRPGHDFRYSIDSTKIRKELGWAPKTSFDVGILATIEFYKNQKNLE